MEEYGSLAKERTSQKSYKWYWREKLWYDCDTWQMISPWHRDTEDLFRNRDSRFELFQLESKIISEYIFTSSVFCLFALSLPLYHCSFSAVNTSLQHWNRVPKNYWLSVTNLQFCCSAVISYHSFPFFTCYTFGNRL